jgi:hypothetical protein
MASHMVQLHIEVTAAPRWWADRLVTLTPASSSCTWSWSPSGNHVAGVSGLAIYVFRRDGSLALAFPGDEVVYHHLAARWLDDSLLAHCLDGDAYFLVDVRQRTRTTITSPWLAATEYLMPGRNLLTPDPTDTLAVLAPPGSCAVIVDPNQLPLEAETIEHVIDTWCNDDPGPTVIGSRGQVISFEWRQPGPAPDINIGLPEAGDAVFSAYGDDDWIFGPYTSATWLTDDFAVVCSAYGTVARVSVADAEEDGHRAAHLEILPHLASLVAGPVAGGLLLLAQHDRLVLVDVEGDVLAKSEPLPSLPVSIEVVADDRIIVKCRHSIIVRCTISAP